MLPLIPLTSITSSLLEPITRNPFPGEPEADAVPKVRMLVVIKMDLLNLMKIENSSWPAFDRGRRK